MIDAGRKREAAEINPGQVILGWKSQVTEADIGGGQVSMSLCRRIVGLMEDGVGADAWREAGDGRARVDSDASGNLTDTGIGDGGSAQNGEILGCPERLRGNLSCETCQRREGEEESRDEPAAKEISLSIHDSAGARRIEADAQPWPHRRNAFFPFR